jgi:LmbE family N-acetylglucosaminyl deacetylase
MMFKISLGNQEKPIPREILFLGAHSDDLEIGCGGTILRLIEEYPQLCITWIVFGASGIRADEARKSADIFLKGVKEKQVEILDFRDGYFPYVGAEIKDFFEGLKQRVSPDLIFTHYRHDLHQDHRLICELTWNTFRDHFILEYEIPKFDGDLSSPNFFVPLQQTICRQKVDYLLSTFKSQADKPWFTEDTFLSILRLRGIESQATEKYAEGFYCRKIVV